MSRYYTNTPNSSPTPQNKIPGRQGVVEKIFLTLKIPSETLSNHNLTLAQEQADQALTKAQHQKNKLQVLINSYETERSNILGSISTIKAPYKNGNKLPSNVITKISALANKIKSIDADKARVEVQLNLLENKIAKFQTQQIENELKQTMDDMDKADALLKKSTNFDGGISDIVDDSLADIDEMTEKDETYKEYINSTNKDSVLLNTKVNNLDSIKDILEEADMLAASEPQPEPVNRQQAYTQYNTDNNNNNNKRQDININTNEDDEIQSDMSYLSLLEVLPSIPSVSKAVPNRVYTPPISVKDAKLGGNNRQ